MSVFINTVRGNYKHCYNEEIVLLGYHRRTCTQICRTKQTHTHTYMYTYMHICMISHMHHMYLRTLIEVYKTF